MTDGQLWLFLLSAIAAGAGGGAYLFKVLSERRLYRNHVRWQRQLRELRTEHEREIARLTAALNQAVEKQVLLLDTLSESEETVNVLSAERVPAYENEIAERNERIAALEKSLAHQRARTADAEDHEKTLQQRVESVQEELRQKEQAIAELTAGVPQTGGHGQARSGGPVSPGPDAQREAQIETLSREFNEMRARLPALNDALREREASIEDLIEEIARERHKATLLEQRLANMQAMQTEPVTIGRPTAKIINIQEHREAGSSPGASEAEKRIKDLERDLETWKSRLRDAEDRESGRDDLKQINGIGPVLETRLNELGIFRLHQIAGLGRDDIRRLSDLDPTLPGRIRRFGWIEQAEKLRRKTDSRDRHRPRG